MTTAIDFSKFGDFEGTFARMVPALIKAATEHDQLVDRLRVKEGEISDDIKESARLRNKDSNKRVSVINEQVAKAMEKVAELKAEAYELVKEDLPKPLTEAEIPDVQKQVKDLRLEYKTKLGALHEVAKMLGVTTTLDTIDLPTIKENGRRTGGGKGSGHSGVRLHFKEVYVNGELATAKSTNDPSKTVSNFSVVANKLKSELKTQNIGASNLQEQYFTAAGTRDVASIPNDFKFTFTYVDGELKKEYEIRAVRN